MSKKRKITNEDFNLNETEKNSPEKKQKTVEWNLHDLLNMITDTDLDTAFIYLKQIFPKESYIKLPTLIYVNQLYSLIKSKTYVDRGLEVLKNENKIVLFTCGSGNLDKLDVCICEKNEFNEYITNLIKSEEKNFNYMQKDRYKFVTELFINKILVEVSALSISCKMLKETYELNDKDLTCLVRLGLLIIKNSDHFWISLPGISQFKQDLINARKCFIQIIRKKKVFIINT